MSTLSWLSLVVCVSLAAGCGEDKGGASDRDLTDSGAPEFSSVVNTAPTQPELGIVPTEPTTQSGLEVVLLTESTDPEGDPVTYRYRWSMDGEEVSDYTDAAVPSEATAKDQVWEVSVVPHDGRLYGEAGTATTRILNTPPVVDTAIAGGEGATARETLTCSVEGTFDADGDTVSLGVSWFINGTQVALGETLEPGFHVGGSEVFCRVTPNDGEADGDPVDSPDLIIDNAVPQLVEVTITPLVVHTDGTLLANVVVDEPDGDTIAYSYAWYVNDDLIWSGGDSLDGSDYFDKGDLVSVEVMVSDGAADGLAVRSDEVQVLNTDPVGDSLTLSPAGAATSDDIVATPVGFDADDDSLTWTYAWSVDGVLISGETSDTLPASAIQSGDVVTVEAIPNDGETDGLAVASGSLTIVNTAPTVDSVSLSPASPYTDELLTVLAAGSDADGDGVVLRYAWSVDGTVIAATGSTLDGALWFSRDEIVVVEVTANDGAADSLTTMSASVRILNTAPEGLSVSLSSSSPTTEDALTTTTLGVDDDGDGLIWAHVWYVNGVEIPGETGSRLDPSFTSADDTIYVIATPNDGDAVGTAVTSATATVVNSAPVASGVTLSHGSPYTHDTLTATSSGSDVDGDTIAWSYVWYVNSSEVSGETAATLSGTVHFDRGDTVYVTATPSDDSGTGAAVTSSVVTVLNSVPTDFAIAIDPADPLSDMDLLCEVTSEAMDDDGDVVTYTIGWQVNGLPFTAATTTVHTGDTVDSGDTAGDDLWTCTVTPTDGTDSGTPLTDGVTVHEWTGVRSLTTCGATGASGPAQSDCDAEYTGSLLDGEIIVSAGIQEWEVPFDGDFVITVYGAQGASGDPSYVGGWGAQTEGTFTFAEGDILYMAVGQEGTGQSLGSSGAGGGGTFVVDGAGNPLLVAGGGGGARVSVSQDGCDAVASEYAVIGSSSAAASSCSVKATGLSSGGMVSAISWGSAGAGFFGDGDSEAAGYPWGGFGGSSWANGMLGGATLAACWHASEGGFGGGGSGNGCDGGGGGGGYSGGDGGRVAGGGGSYVDAAATDASKSGAYNEGEGWITIDVD